jgi:carbonic anhydrase
MNIVKVFIIGLLLLFINLTPLLAKENNVVSSDTALQRLIEGNKRYITGEFIHPNQSPKRRTELANKQNPIAVILSCSDSRVPPEIIFDQGLGDLFVIRVAGNVINDEVLGSIEYAVEHLSTQLVIVLGHDRCGAVTAAVNGGNAPGHIKSLVEAIKPAVEKAKKESGDLLENTINDNISMVVQKLKSSKPILDHLVQHNHLKIIGARYDLDNGKVIFTL